MIDLISQPTALFIAGDATAANTPNSSNQQAGWGQMIGEQLGTTSTVYNYALAGQTSKSFINEGHLKNIESKLSTGDFLLIQFGHNDEKKEDPAKYTEPFTTYKENLKYYIHLARHLGAIPILVTPVSRRTLHNTHQDYRQAMIELAKQTQTHLIDLYQKSNYLFERFGMENSKQLFVTGDDTHFNLDGARVISSLVIEGLLELDLPQHLIIPY